MKNIFKISVAALLSATMLSSCIEETFPDTSTATAEQVAKSPTALKALLNGIPMAMMKSNTAGYLKGYEAHWDFGIPGIHIMTENLLEDVATLGDNPGYNRFYPWAQNRAQGETYIYCAYFWDCYYPWIKNCNDVIKLIDPETATAETIGYLGQALAYRAMCYLDLARLFEPKENGYTEISGDILGLTVPLVTELTTEKEGGNNPRAPREEMYAYIISSLEQAEECLKDVTYNYTSPTLGAVYGLMARAYLEMGAAGDAGAYAKAAEYARKAITTSGCTPLTLAQWEDPINGFNNGAANNSWIWGNTLATELTENIVTFTAHMSTEATWGYGMDGRIGASKRFYEQIDDKDFRKFSWIDPRGDAFHVYKINGDRAEFLAAAADYQSLKFRPAQGEIIADPIGNCADHPLMRVEEMYFIEMEATAHSNLGSARTLLNDFMKFRITDGSYDCAGVAGTLDNFLKEMLFQKRVEFWGEGVLIFDYKRLNAGITRGYPGTNHPAIFRYNSEGRSPAWNIVITRGESQGNIAITTEMNNPDPTGTMPQWLE